MCICGPLEKPSVVDLEARKFLQPAQNLSLVNEALEVDLAPRGLDPHLDRFPDV